MRDFGARCITFAFTALAVISSISINSCKDKFTTQVADTVRDTTIKVDTTIKLVLDTIITHDTVDLDDSSVWVFRNSGTNETLIISQFVNSTVGFIGGGPVFGNPGNGIIIGTTDAGSNWQMLDANIGTSGSGGNDVYGISFLDPQNGFAIGDGQNVYRTADGGHTWASTPSNSSLFLRSICFIDANNGFIGTSDPYNPGNGSGQDGEILRTQDGGNTWALAYTSTGGGIYHINFINAMNGVALGRYGVALWTSDGGNTWNVGSTDQPLYGPISRSTFVSSTTGFAVDYIDATHGDILRTDDAGHTWHTIQLVPYGITGISTNGSGVITVCGEGGAVIESTDGNGKTWNITTVGTQRWIDVKYAGSGRTVLVGVNGRIMTRDK